MLNLISKQDDENLIWRHSYDRLNERLRELQEENEVLRGRQLWLTGPPPRKGQRQRYPSRFWFNFKKHYPITDDMKILHMFSGSMDWGDTTDIRPESGAQIVAPYDDLPIPDNTYDMVIADPPYTCGFANEWITHPKDLPKPKRIQAEAARVTKPGGLIAMLHVIIVGSYKVNNVENVAWHGILCGHNNAIRVLNVWRKKEGSKK